MMRTVKEVAGLSGISVRTLQYYDEIGIFKPTRVTNAGYRLYDDEALKTLQQILFFKELDFPLKEIKEIMADPNFDKLEAFRKQKELLRVKRDRLDKLLGLLDKLEKGESCMSFEEFDLSEYIQVLEKFKKENAPEVIKHWGSVEKFEEFMNKIKENEVQVAEAAVRQYGNVEKYTAAMKHSMEHFSENIEKMEQIKKGGYIDKNKALHDKLFEDLTKEPESDEIQCILDEIVKLGQETEPDMDHGEYYWDMMIDWYLHKESVIQAVDKMHGIGASKFMGRALQYYFKRGDSPLQGDL